MIAKLLRENLTVLTQGLELLETLPPAIYTAMNPETYGSSAGAHFRHILQHFQAYTNGFEKGLVDYDHRDRNSDIEFDRDAAISVIYEISKDFSAFSLMDKPLLILQNYDPKQPKQPVQSSVARELTFLVSHSIHHYALVAAILRLHGIDVPRFFGFAPSTMYYLAGVAGVQQASLMAHE
ncbi:MAG: DinB family protein [Spirochaetota bacterium]